MSKPSKRYNTAKSAVEEGKVYSTAEAITALKQHPAKFDETVELHIKLGINPKKSDQVVRGSVQLPHGTGKTVVVAAFVNSNQEDEAKSAGADIIATEEVIAEIKKTGNVKFDVAVATPDMMKKIGPIARVLGQKGLMPNPKTETVGPDVKGMIEAVKAGKVNFKNDDTANVHIPAGKLSFSDEKLQENIAAIVDGVQKAKPSASKGTYITSATVTSTMGPGLKVKV